MTGMTPLSAIAHRPYFPAPERLQRYWHTIEANGWLTNHGPLVTALEQRLADWLGVPYVVMVANGTLALQIASKVLDLHGEVMTSPLSFVATPNALAWEGLTPTFADVDAGTLTLDPRDVIQRLTPRTCALAPVHLFSQACDVHTLDGLARDHGLKLLYDAAQAFGLQHEGRSILTQGDISVLSFHATKIFHTVEGGALILHNAEHHDRALHYRSHGRLKAHEAPGLGINAKLSELHAAVGHCVLDDLPQRIQHHQAQRRRYAERLARHVGQRVTLYDDASNPDHQYKLYLPLLWSTPMQCRHVDNALACAGLTLRRYFDPPLHQLPHFGTPPSCPIAEDLAPRLMCLPLPPHASLDFVDQVCDTIDNALLR